MGIIPNPADAPTRYKQLIGTMEHKEKGVPTGEISRRYDKRRYRFLLDAPFEIDAKCCDIMKKGPFHRYQRETGRYPITAQMAQESRLRTANWLQHGCNGFDMKDPKSNPMAFWTEQDVLLYIKENDITIASVYGEITEDYEATGNIPGQMSICGMDQEVPLKTTGCQRTGCMFCGYGCHLEKEPNRFQRMKETHPALYDYIMRPWEQEADAIDPNNGEMIKIKKTGLNYKAVIDWINEHGNMDIKY